VSDDLKRWAETWTRAARALAALEAASAVDTQVAVQQLMPVFRLAREALPHTTTSGLVEMRRLLDRSRG
jgi:hypothetical protein